LIDLDLSPSNSRASAGTMSPRQAGSHHRHQLRAGAVTHVSSFHARIDRELGFEGLIALPACRSSV
jgi:hypothetical protein